MSIPILYLNEAEENALRAFARGLDNRGVYNLGLIPLSGIWVFSYEICRKTGISSLSHTVECRHYIERYEAAMANPAPLSPEQKSFVQFFKDKTPADGIAYRLKKDLSELDGILDKACATMGIFTRDQKARRMQFAAYLAVFHPWTSGLELIEETILRKWSEGASFVQLALDFKIEEVMAKTIVHRAAHKLQLNTRGRGTQRNLVHSYFRFMDWKNAQETPVTMDDPAF